MNAPSTEPQPQARSPWLNPRRAIPALALVMIGLAVVFNMFERSALPVGSTLPDLQVTLDDGSELRLGGPQPAPVVLNFWATWCMPCRQEAPILNALHDEGVRVIGVAVDPLPLRKVVNHGRKLGMRYPLSQAGTEITNRFSVGVIPTTYVVGTDGKVLLAETGLVALKTLRQALSGS